jgi:predicted alpha/beta-fold hydrolase
VGFSLGGNVVLKLAGELGDEGRRSIAGVCAVSTPLDLGVCARRINQRENWLYQRRFVHHMRRRLCATGRYTRAQLAGLDSVFAIDDRITAPSFGFRDAEHYYSTQSCTLFLESIRVPALLIQAKDDTFIPFELYEHPALRRNVNLRLIATGHGGHLGFISRTGPRFWVDEVILEWIGEQTPQRQ